MNRRKGSQGRREKGEKEIDQMKEQSPPEMRTWVKEFKCQREKIISVWAEWIQGPWMEELFLNDKC